MEDFAVSAPLLEIANAFFQRLDDTLLEPLKLQGIILYFNSVNLRQGRDFVTITCEMYLDCVFERHGWTQIATALSA